MAEARAYSERRASQATARLARMAAECGVDLEAMSADIAYIWHNWNKLEPD
jgi:hypothetical protein